MKKRAVAALLLLCLGALCLLPVQSYAAADIFFVAVNDAIPLTLSNAAAPYLEGGVLYAPRSVFEASGLGVAPSYNESLGTFTLFSRQQRLVFDLKNGGSNTEEGVASTTSAVVRGGVIYVPVVYCARHFGLAVGMLTSADGYRILRFTNGQQVYNNNLFLEKAENFIREKAQQYQGGESDKPTLIPEDENQQTTPTIDSETNKTPARVYLAVTNAETMVGALAVLRAQAIPATFFLTAQEIGENKKLVCDIRAAGYPIGLAAEGEGDVTEELGEGNEALAALFATKTLMVLLQPNQTASGYFTFDVSKGVTPQKAAERSGSNNLIICQNGASRVLSELRDANARYRYLRETTRF